MYNPAKYLLLFMISCMLCACAQFAKVQPLQQGGRITIVSNLDNEISYYYIGTTVFQNTHFQYSASTLDAGRTIISPVRNTLQNKGYKVSIVPVDSTTSSSTISSKAFLSRMIPLHQADRIIVITKEKTYMGEHMPTNNAAGYGYVQKEFLGMKNTMPFASISIKVIDPKDYSIQASRYVNHVEYKYNGIGDLLSNRTPRETSHLFSKSANEVSPESVTYLSDLLKERFTPEVMEAVQALGL